jgi:tetratricopeptide (TPR) repeat protein
VIEKCKDALRKDDLEKAIEYGKRAVEMYPNNFDSYFCLGKAYHRMRQPELAYENFKKAEELASSKEDLASIYEYIGRILAIIGKLDDALTYYNKALGLTKEIGGKAAPLLRTIAEIYFKKKDLDKALDYYDAAFTAGEEEGVNEEFMAEIINDMSIIYAELGFYKEAITLLKDLILFGNLSENDHIVYVAEINLGAVYGAMGNKEAAKRYLSMGLNHVKKIGDKYWEAVAYFHLGRILNKKKYSDKANEIFKEIGVAGVNHWIL